MKLFPVELLAQVPPLYATEEVEPEEKLAYLKVFDPCGRGAWYGCEFSPEEGVFFGYVVSPLGPDCDEWGYFSLEELQQVRDVFGLHLERDVHWTPRTIPGLQGRSR